MTMVGYRLNFNEKYKCLSYCFTAWIELRENLLANLCIGDS